MTCEELAHRVGLSRSTIKKYVAKGVLPRPSGYGRWASYDPICVKLIEQLHFIRDYHVATLDDLAERRQITGQLLPPTGRLAP